MENAENLTYEKLDILGQTALFTCLRIDRDTVPEDMHAYDLRHDDECQGIICEIAPFIMVNHWGTILCREPIALMDNGRRYVTEEDYSYTGEELTLDELLVEAQEEGVTLQ